MPRDLPYYEKTLAVRSNWGQVYGSLTAVRHLRERGGALINVGSALCDRAIPLQANYCAAKHALKGFTDALRNERDGNRHSFLLELHAFAEAMPAQQVETLHRRAWPGTRSLLISRQTTCRGVRECCDREQLPRCCFEIGGGHSRRSTSLR